MRTVILCAAGLIGAIVLAQAVPVTRSGTPGFKWGGASCGGITGGCSWTTAHCVACCNTALNTFVITPGMHAN